MVVFIPTSSTFWRLNREDGNFEDNFGHGTRPVTDTASPPPQEEGDGKNSSLEGSGGACNRTQRHRGDKQGC